MTEIIWVPCRITSAIDLQAQILDGIHAQNCAAVDTDETNHAKLLIEADVKTLAELRAQFLRNGSEPVDVQLDAALIYLSGLLSLARCTRLDQIKFPWTNSLSCSRAVTQQSGLFYEIANVSFNVAALYTQKAAQSSAHNVSSLLRMAAGVWNFLEFAILPRVFDIPPPELSGDAIIFFQRLCLVQASCLESRTASTAWALVKEFDKLLADVGRLPFQNSKLHSQILSKRTYLECFTYLDLARSLHRSRKRGDQLLEKSILMKCQHLTSDEKVQSEITRLLHEPKTRRTRFTLYEIGEVEEFNPESYFAEVEASSALDSVPFAPPTSKLFEDLLPEQFVMAPLVLKLRYLHYVDNMICRKLEEMNHKTRECLTIHDIPMGVEMTLRPGSIPASLIPMLATLGKQVKADDTKNEYSHRCIHPQYEEVEKLLSRCEAILSRSDVLESRQTWHESLSSVQKSWTQINRFLEENQELFFLLHRCCNACEDEEVLRAVLCDILKLPSIRQTKHQARSTPAFMEKAQKLFEVTHKKILERDARWRKILADAQSISFFHEVKVLVKAGDICSQPVDKKTLEGILETALKSLKPELDYVATELAATEQHLSDIREFSSKFKAYTRQLLTKERSAEPTLALMFVVAKWYDLDYDISCLVARLKVFMNIALLGIANNKVEIHNKSRKPQLNSTLDSICSATAEIDKTGVTRQFNWKQGSSIDICIE